MPNTMVFNSVRFVRKKNLMSEIRDLPADQIEDKISRQYEYVSVIEQLLSFNESKRRLRYVCRGLAGSGKRNSQSIF